MTVTITTHSPAQTQALAERLAKLLRPGDVLAYTGPMGAGKPPLRWAWPGAWAAAIGSPAPPLPWCRNTAARCRSATSILPHHRGG